MKYGLSLCALLLCTASLFTLPTKQDHEKIQPSAPPMDVPAQLLYQEVQIQYQQHPIRIVSIKSPSPEPQEMCCTRMCKRCATCLDTSTDRARARREDCLKGCNIFKNTQIYKKFSSIFKCSCCSSCELQKPTCPECSPCAPCTCQSLEGSLKCNDVSCDDCCVITAGICLTPCLPLVCVGPCLCCIPLTGLACFVSCILNNLGRSR